MTVDLVSSPPTGGKLIIAPDNAAPPAGPYSHAVKWGGFVFLSGQVPRDPDSGSIVKGSVAAQTERMLENVRALLDAASVQFSDVVKTTVFLTDMNDFAAMNEVYGRYFSAPYPARSTVAVSALPLGARMEIEVVAAKSLGGKVRD